MKMKSLFSFTFPIIIVSLIFIVALNNNFLKNNLIKFLGGHTEPIIKEVEREVYIEKEPITFLEEINIPDTKHILKLDNVIFPYFNLGNLHYKNNIEYAVEVFRNYEYIVISSEPVTLEKHYKEQRIVADKLTNIAKLFGYIEAGKSKNKTLHSMSEIKEEIDNIAQVGWYGVFFDQFGYDYEETRQRQNEMIVYAHNKGLVCFTNTWSIDDVFLDIVSEDHNPSGESIKLIKDDWYLLESFYSTNSGYKDNFEKYIEASKIAMNLGIKISTLSYKRDEITWDEANQDIENSYLLALLLGFEGWSFIDTTVSEKFLHGKIPDFNLGTTLVEPLSYYENNLYRAKTDKYIIEIDTTKYPNFTYKVFEEVQGYK